jgi:hypothetical protein
MLSHHLDRRSSKSEKANQNIKLLLISRYCTGNGRFYKLESVILAGDSISIPLPTIYEDVQTPIPYQSYLPTGLLQER